MPWADLPERYGPYTTVYNRFDRWRKAGVWDKLMDAIIAAHDGKVQMIDSTSVCAHQQAAAKKTGWRRLYRSKSWRTVDQAAFAGDRQWPACATRIVAWPDA
jgi:transposase